MENEHETATLSVWLDHGGDSHNPITPNIEVGDTYIHPDYPAQDVIGRDPDAWMRQAEALAMTHGWRLADGAEWSEEWTGARRYRIAIVREVREGRDLTVTRDGTGGLTYRFGSDWISTDESRFGGNDDLWRLEAVTWARTAGAQGYRLKSGSWWTVDGFRSTVRMVLDVT